MHGLIFVTWEKFLAERFGSTLLHQYRSAIGETMVTAPLVSRVYDDATLLAGVGAACQLTGVPADTLLREYGRYFMLNGLTSHLCAYLLTQVHSGAELLLTMRDAHAQMRRTPDGLTPPLFAYEALSTDPNRLTLIYDSPAGCVLSCGDALRERQSAMGNESRSENGVVCSGEPPSAVSRCASFVLRLQN
jgi:hypothetical protein